MVSSLMVIVFFAAVFMQNHDSSHKFNQSAKPVYSLETNKREDLAKYDSQTTGTVFLQKVIEQRNDLSKRVNDIQVN